MKLNALRERSRFRKYEADYVAARGGVCFIQGDQSIANQAGAAFRSDLNNELQALVTNSHGATVPGTTYRNMIWHDTTLNLIRRRNAANTGWINVDTLDESFVLSRSSNTILGQSDIGKMINATAAFTQTFTAAATLGDKWWCAYNAGGFSVVLDPNGAELIDGAATTTVTGSGLIYCNGTAFFTVGFNGLANDACDFRLTLTSATPVTTSDVTGATTIYCTPYKGKYIDLYDGVGTWARYASAEFSLALGTLTSGKPYDVFCYANAGVPTLEFLAWTSDLVRATALVYQDGVLVKSGATTRRYLGTFYTTSTTQTEDSIGKRYLWNYYNRVVRSMKAVDTTNTWTYTTATWRQANANTANQLNFVCGVAEDSVESSVYGKFTNSSSAGYCEVGIGLNSTSANSAQIICAAQSVATADIGTSAHYRGTVSAGRNFLAWLEQSVALGTTTWRGDDGSTEIQFGIIGSIQA